MENNNQLNYEFENDLNNELFNEFEATEESESSDTKSEIKYPFDPRQIKITVETSTIYGLASRTKRKEIDLYPDFQRKGNLWKPDRQSRLIESLLLRFPLPAFYFDVEDSEKWLVVDGLQRLSTIKNFIVDNTLKLEGLEILTNYEGLTFAQLDSTLRRRILETNITTFLIQPGTPKEVKYNVFKRINTGGLGLTPMEIRHALNQKGNAGTFLKIMTEEEKEEKKEEKKVSLPFSALIGDNRNFFKDFFRINRMEATRMEDRELLLRYVAFSLTPYTDYEPNLSNFLDKAMENLDLLSEDECVRLSINLQKAMNTYITIFGSKRFGRTLTNRCRLNSALFEVWTSELGKLNDNERELLISKKSDFKSIYQQFLDEDNVFNSSFTRSTSNKSAVETRFNKIHNLIQKMLHDSSDYN